MTANSTDESDVEEEQVDRSMGANPEDLSRKGFRRTESECHLRDCEGTIWYDHHTILCIRCGHCEEMSARREHIDRVSPRMVFRNRVDRYAGSRRVRMVGGYTEAYNWNATDGYDSETDAISADDAY